MQRILLGLSLGLVPSLACSASENTSKGAGGSVASSGGASGASQGGLTSSGGATSGGSSSGGAASGGAGSGSMLGGSSNGGSVSGGGSFGGASSAGAGGTSAGSSGSAGSTGTSGGSGGAGTAGSGSAGYTGKILVEDNFDKSTVAQSPDMTKWRGPSVGDSNQPVDDATRAHSPPNAAKITGTSIGNGSFLVPLMGVLPAPNNRFYVRVFINFEKATSMVTGHIGFIVGADSRDNSGTELRLGISTPPGFGSGMLDLNLQNPKDGGGGEVTRFSNGYTTGGNPLNMPGFTFDANHWYCVESLFNGGMNEFRVWVDDSEVTSLHVTDFSANTTPRTMWAPSFSVLKIGAQNYGGDIGQIWYDDVVVGTERIRCQ